MLVLIQFWAAWANVSSATLTDHMKRLLRPMSILSRKTIFQSHSSDIKSKDIDSWGHSRWELKWKNRTRCCPRVGQNPGFFIFNILPPFRVFPRVFLENLKNYNWCIKIFCLCYFRIVALKVPQVYLIWHKKVYLLLSFLLVSIKNDSRD